MLDSEDTLPIFEFLDSTLIETEPELLGLWRTKHPSLDVPFALDSATTANTPIWRANFPSALQKADEFINKAEERVIKSEQALNIAGKQINWIVSSINDRGEAGAAFGLSSINETLTLPEQELLTSLQEILGSGKAQSFSVRTEQGQVWKQTYEQFHSFTQWLLCSVTHYAWVETQLQRETFAQTRVGWTGDVHSIWIEAANAEHIVLHQRTLALALSSRNMLLMTLSMTVQIALRLSVLLTLPGGAVLALPAIWKFINQIMTQFRGGKNYGYS